MTPHQPRPTLFPYTTLFRSPSGLYMTQAHFVDDFEGWLKGAPEFEVHVLGQKGQSDSLTDYQCAGEKQPAPYYFDQNGRSEEHTSELQSHSDLVCRLLLEKK